MLTIIKAGCDWFSRLRTAGSHAATRVGVVVMATTTGLRTGGFASSAPAASQMGGIFFLWAPLNFDDLCLHYQLFDDNVGRPLFQVGARLPVYGSPDELPGVEDPAVEHMRNLEHEVTFASGSRMITGATIAMTSVADGVRHEVRLLLQLH